MSAARKRSDRAVQRYVMISAARSGTNLLNHMIGSHPQVVAAGELFDDNAIKEGIIPWPDPSVRRDPKLVELWAREPLALAEELFARSRVPACRVVGFRLMYDQGDTHADVIDHLVGNTDYFIIHLKRRNLLRRHLSLKRAVKTQTWLQSAGDSEAADSTPMELDLFQCLRDFQAVESYRARYDDLFRHHNVLEVSYEDLAEHPQAIAVRVIQFLGLEQHGDLRIDFRKTGVDPLRGAVSNYDELKSNLSRWLSFFDE